MADFALPQVLDEISRQAAQFGVNPDTAKALMLAENTRTGSMSEKSTISGDARSPMGAAGVMQVMPQTALGLQKAGFLPASWSYDPDNLSSQVQAGLAALKEKQQRMNNPDDLGELASIYNGSTATHRAYKAGNIAALPAETQAYIPKLRRAFMELTGTNNPSAVGPDPSTQQPAPVAPATSTSTTSRTKRNVNDPEALNMFLSDAMGAVGAGGTFDQAENTVRTQTAARDSAATDLQAAISAKAVAAGQVAAADAATTAAGQAKRAQILAVANMTPDNTQGELERLMGVVNATDAKLGELKPEIDKRMAVGFFDNPLEWLVNQTRLPGMVSEYNSIVGTQKDAQQRFAGIATAATTQQSASSATDADLVLAAGKAKAEEAEKAAAVEAGKIRYETAGDTIRNQLMLTNLTGQKIGIGAAILRETKQVQTDSTVDSERTAAAKAAADDLTSINGLIVAAGGSPLTSLKQLPSSKVETLKSAATSGRFGKDFAESFQFVSNDGNIENIRNKGGAAVARWVQGTNSEVGKDLQTELEKQQKLGNKAFKAKEYYGQVLNGIQTKYSQEANGNMRNASDFNPYKLDYDTAIKDPALEKNPVAIWLRQSGPSGTEPMMPKVDEQFVVTKFAQSVALGTMKASEAAQALTDFYKSATQAQMMRNKPQLFGLDTPSKTYPVTLTGIGSTPLNLDLGNYADVERALTKKVAYDRAMSMLTSHTSMPFPIR